MSFIDGNKERRKRQIKKYKGEIFMQERNKKMVSQEHMSFDGFCDYMRIAVGQNLGSEYIVYDVLVEVQNYE